MISSKFEKQTSTISIFQIGSYVYETDSSDQSGEQEVKISIETDGSTIGIEVYIDETNNHIHLDKADSELLVAKLEHFLQDRQILQS